MMSRGAGQARGPARHANRGDRTGRATGHGDVSSAPSPGASPPAQAHAGATWPSPASSTGHHGSRLTSPTESQTVSTPLGAQSPPGIRGPAECRRGSNPTPLSEMQQRVTAMAIRGPRRTLFEAGSHGTVPRRSGFVNSDGLAFGGVQLARTPAARASRPASDQPGQSRSGYRLRRTRVGPNRRMTGRAQA